MKEPTEIYINLNKCTEEQQKHIFSLLPKPTLLIQYQYDEHNCILEFDNEDGQWWVDSSKPPINKTELTYPEFIKLFEKQKTVSESLKEYFKNTPKEQVIKDWESVSEFDNVNSPKVSELFEGGDGEKALQVGKILNYLADRNDELAKKPCFENACRMAEISRVIQMIKSNNQ